MYYAASLVQGGTLQYLPFLVTQISPFPKTPMTLDVTEYNFTGAHSKFRPPSNINYIDCKFLKSSIHSNEMEEHRLKYKA
jgi:hypothetical protein